MIGYIEQDPYSTKKERMIFRRNYCMLCRALEKNYGERVRFLLSYDVTLISLFLIKDEEFRNIPKIRCFNRSEPLKELSTSETYRKLTSMSMILVGGEFEDKIHDEDGKLYKIVYPLFRKAVNKARKAYPAMAKIVDEGTKKGEEAELRGAGLEEMEDCYAEMIKRLLVEEFGLEDEVTLSLLIHAAKCIYFMDAIDDLDKDIAKGHFNPFTSFGSKRNLIKEGLKYLNDHYQKIRGEMPFELINARKFSHSERTGLKVVMRGIPFTLRKLVAKGGKA